MRQEFQDASRSSWGGAAQAWKRAAEQPEQGASALMAQRMLELAQLREGEHVLELAAGAARVGLQAAEQVGPTGRVVCSDFAPSMVEAVAERLQQLALPHVEARVLDAQALELGPRERFDAVLCRNGLMLVSDPRTALGESRRALKPGGRLSLGVWGRGDRNPWITAITDPLMARLGAPPPAPGTPGPFALSDTEQLAAMIAAAGLDPEVTERLDAEQPYESADAWWDHLLTVSPALGSVVGALAEEDVRAVRDAAMENAAGHRAPDGAIVFPAEIVVALARRPLE